MKILNYKNLALLGFILLLSAGYILNKSADIKLLAPKETSGPTFVPTSIQTPNPEAKILTSEMPGADNKQIPTLPTNCASDFDCYQTYYQKIVKNFGVTQAFAQLKEQFKINSYVQTQCHPLTHVVGQGAIELYANVSEAYTHGDSFCWSGYYHGVMEGIVGKVGRANFPKMLNDFCSDIPGKNKYSFDYFNCVHGLGHGVMAYTNDELFDSLNMCQGLTGSWEQSSCFGGVFMENVIIDNKNHFTKFLKKDDLLYPCNAVDAQYKHECYIMQTSYVLKENGGDFPATFSICERSDPGFEDVCNQSLGRDASSRSNYNNSGIKNICMQGKNYAQQSNCIIGAVKDVISYFHSDTQAKEFCESLTPNLQGVCATTLVSYYKSF